MKFKGPAQHDSITVANSVISVIQGLTDNQIEEIEIQKKVTEASIKQT